MFPHLTAAQSAALARRMLVATAVLARRHWPGRVLLFIAPSPNPNHPLLVALTRRLALEVTTQRGADLGARMQHALSTGIASAGAAAVMGCDVPHCGGEILTRAHAILAAGGSAIGPAVDRGFYLLGLQHADRGLFAGINWGESATPLADLTTRATAAGITLTRLPTLRDIDRFPDLQWLARRHAAYQRFVP